MKRDFDSAAKTWDQNDARTRMSHAIADVMIASLKLTGSETVLDYGTGTGNVALRFQPVVKQVIAADSSRGMLDVLGEKIKETGVANVSTLLLDLEKDSLNPKLHPDVIVSAMTLHHIADTGRFAQVLHAMLPSGGRIALADLDAEGGDFHSDNTGVEHFGFDREALAQAFAEAGFPQTYFQTAYEVTRPNDAGVPKTYPIFLLLAQKS